ncbi:MAG: SusD/RagB family nutrient-binding outer membrane lipoprotein [Gemmatimonadaceae bacterium]
MLLSKFPRAAAAVALAATLAACDQGLTGINEDPNAPREVSAQLLFPQGVTSVVGLLRGAGFDLELTSLWAQHYAKIQYTDEDWYNIRPGTIDTYWSSFYAGGLADFAEAIRQAEAAKEPNLIAPAKVMRSWTFGAMTDLWGDIPYSEASKGQENLTPKYDAQQDVYAGILAELKESSDMITADGTGYADADLIYGGDMTKWKKFANSLRLRYAMRLSKADPTKARSEIAAALAAGVFTSNADNAELQWPGDGTNDSPLYANFRTRNDHRVSKTLVDILQGSSDPRLAVYARPTQADATKYVGVPNGLKSPDATALGLTRTSRIGARFALRDAPSMLMDYAEVLFIQAEAAARGWTTGNAAALYAAAITASMQRFGVTGSGITSYLAQPSVAYNASTGLQQIALQKWIALFGQGIEAWAEWRRTGVPNLQPGPAATIGMVARRLRYPLSEQSYNNTNLLAAIARQGADEYTTRIYIDKP